MYSTPDFRRGLKIEIERVPYEIIEFQHVKPGKGGAFVRTKLKNLLTHAVVDKTFRAGEKVAIPDLEMKDTTYLYRDGEGFHFMDLSTYESILITEQHISKEITQFLKENLAVKVLLYQGKPIDFELPIFVEALVIESEPGIKGDTAQGATKPATLETGAVIQVPLHVKQGDVVKIDTRTGIYVEKVS